MTKTKKIFFRQHVAYARVYDMIDLTRTAPVDRNVDDCMLDHFT